MVGAVLLGPQQCSALPSVSRGSRPRPAARGRVAEATGLCTRIECCGRAMRRHGNMLAPSEWPAMHVLAHTPREGDAIWRKPTS